MITRNVKGEYRITGTNRELFFGLSTDTKPTDDTVPNGAEFREMDTTKTYYFDKENKLWREWSENETQ